VPGCPSSSVGLFFKNILRCGSLEFYFTNEEIRMSKERQMPGKPGFKPRMADFIAWLFSTLKEK
jgi:hypothetical protein